MELLNSQHTAAEKFDLKAKIFAWGVHGFTASGIVVGLLAIVAIAQHQWAEAMALLLCCAVIDGVDGTLARHFKVKEVLPDFDGKTIDYVIDFATYAIIPAYFVYESSMVPESMRLVAAGAILFVSSFYYGKKGMVSDDFYFVGFPVMWNLVIMYFFFIFSFSEWWNFIWILVFCVLHFVPIKYLYPSRTVENRLLTLTITAIGVFSYPFILYIYPEQNLFLNGAAIFMGAYYMFMAIYKTYFDL